MIFTQGGKQALHAHRVVGVIHDHTARFRGVYDLHAPVDLQMLKPVLKLFCRHTGRKRHRRRRKRIVYIKSARDIHPHRNPVFAADIKLDADKIRLGHIADILRLKVRTPA